MNAQSAQHTIRRNRLRVSELHPDDYEDIVRLVSSCSPETRFLRFHTGVETLRPSMARQLAATNGHTVVGLGLRNWRGRLVADARYALTEPRVAETAILITDKYQGRGLGPALLRILFDRARAEGILAMHAEILHSNRAMIGALAKLGPVHHLESRDGVQQVCIPLTEAACPSCVHPQAEMSEVVEHLTVEA